MVFTTDDRTHTFRLYHPTARSVQVLMECNGWHNAPIDLAQDPQNPGWWHAQVSLHPGDHLFAYHIDNATWLPDYAASGLQRNEFGGWVSLLHVPDRSARSAA